ncbi:MAG: ABC transporter permease, partial [Oscillospiraceae bacterium]|nr:ABC transporter permease [Oscillospiraceae bacterium]
GNFTLQNIAQLPNYQATFMLSIWLGLVATVICLIIAYPIAYIISQSSANVQRTMILLVMLPMWMNLLIRTYSWMTILEDTGIINTLLTKIGLPPVHMINTQGAVVLGMVYNFLPYMILPIYTVMEKMDKSLVEACADLGGNRLHVVSKVIFPLSLPGVISGLTMVFVPSVSTFYISQKLGGTNSRLIGDVIEQQFKSANNYNLGAALSLILMIMILICMAVMNHFSDEDDKGGRIVV